jgi:hypothetical protein
MLDLVKITGVALSVNFESGLLSETEESSKKDLDSFGEKSGAAKYLRSIVNDDGGVIEMARSSGKDPRTEAGHLFGKDFINWDPFEIDANIYSFEQSETGLNPLTMGYGMIFLHESLHTKFGAKQYNGSEKGLTDPMFDDSATGETVDAVNEFREGAGLAERTTYQRKAAFFGADKLGRFALQKYVFMKDGKKYDVPMKKPDEAWKEKRREDARNTTLGKALKANQKK